MRVYATADQYGTPTPDNVDLLLRTASRTVDHLLRGRVYDVDADLMPTDPDVAEAMADATVAIARELDATGVLTAGSSTEWDQVKIGSVSLGSKRTAPGSVTVAGMPVPPAALAAIADVGRFTLNTGGATYPRLLDRVAR